MSAPTNRVLYTLQFLRYTDMYILFKYTEISFAFRTTDKESIGVKFVFKKHFIL
jgi:hypothetical protein